MHQSRIERTSSTASLIRPRLPRRPQAAFQLAAIVTEQRHAATRARLALPFEPAARRAWLQSFALSHDDGDAGRCSSRPYTLSQRCVPRQDTSARDGPNKVFRASDA